MLRASPPANGRVRNWPFMEQRINMGAPNPESDGLNAVGIIVG